MVSVANAVVRQDSVLALWRGLVPVGITIFKVECTI